MHLFDESDGVCPGTGVTPPAGGWSFFNPTCSNGGQPFGRCLLKRSAEGIDAHRRVE